MTTEPLGQTWERAAVKELTDILNFLCLGYFVSPQDLCDRLYNSAKAIELVEGQGQQAQVIYLNSAIDPKRSKFTSSQQEERQE